MLCWPALSFSNLLMPYTHTPKVAKFVTRYWRSHHSKIMSILFGRIQGILNFTAKQEKTHDESPMAALGKFCVLKT